MKLQKRIDLAILQTKLLLALALIEKFHHKVQHKDLFIEAGARFGIRIRPQVIDGLMRALVFFISMQQTAARNFNGMEDSEAYLSTIVFSDTEPINKLLQLSNEQRQESLFQITNSSSMEDLSLDQMQTPDDVLSMLSGANPFEIINLILKNPMILTIIGMSYPEIHAFAPQLNTVENLTPLWKSIVRQLNENVERISVKILSLPILTDAEKVFKERVYEELLPILEKFSSSLLSSLNRLDQVDDRYPFRTLQNELLREVPDLQSEIEEFLLLFSSLEFYTSQPLQLLSSGEFQEHISKQFEIATSEESDIFQYVELFEKSPLLRTNPFEKEALDLIQKAKIGFLLDFCDKLDGSLVETALSCTLSIDSLAKGLSKSFDSARLDPNQALLIKETMENFLGIFWLPSTNHRFTFVSLSVETTEIFSLLEQTRDGLFDLLLREGPILNGNITHGNLETKAHVNNMFHNVIETLQNNTIISAEDISNFSPYETMLMSFMMSRFTKEIGKIDNTVTVDIFRESVKDFVQELEKISIRLLEEKGVQNPSKFLSKKKKNKPTLSKFYNIAIKMWQTSNMTNVDVSWIWSNVLVNLAKIILLVFTMSNSLRDTIWDFLNNSVNVPPHRMSTWLANTKSNFHEQFENITRWIASRTWRKVHDFEKLDQLSIVVQVCELFEKLSMHKIESKVQRAYKYIFTKDILKVEKQPYILWKWEEIKTYLNNRYDSHIVESDELPLRDPKLFSEMMENRIGSLVFHVAKNGTLLSRAIQLAEQHI